jgi:hypothetical protein
MWPGSAPSETWDFPIVTTGGLAPSISVLSAGEDDVLVSVDILTEGGLLRNAREVTIDSSVPALIPLDDLALPPFGVRLRSTAPIAAAVVAVTPSDEVDGGEGDLGEDLEDVATTTTEASTTTVDEGEVVEETFIRGLAGSVGISTPSSGWIVPMDTLPENQTTIWILNPGGSEISVDVEPLGEVEFHGGEQTIVVGPGSIGGIEVDVGIGVFGYHVVADGPVSVAWEMSGDRGAVLVAGIPDQ